MIVHVSACLRKYTRVCVCVCNVGMGWAKGWLGCMGLKEGRGGVAMTSVGESGGGEAGAGSGGCRGGRGQRTGWTDEGDDGIMR